MHLQVFLEFEHRAMCYMGLFSEPIHQHELGLLSIKLCFGAASVAVLVMKPKEMIHLIGIVDQVGYSKITTLSEEKLLQRETSVE